MLLSHYSGGPLLGISFSVIGSSLDGRSRLGFVDSVDESPVVVLIWPSVAWPGQTKVCKLAALCFFLALISKFLSKFLQQRC